MKQLHFFLYIIALVVVLIPIALNEMQRPIGQPLGNIILIAGLFILICGKLVAIKTKKGKGERTQADYLLVIILAGMIIWTLFNIFAS